MPTKVVNTLVLTTCLGGLSFFSPSSTAAGNALGTDAIRWLDQGYGNVIYQYALTRASAVQVQFGLKDEEHYLINGSYKAYTEGYHSSVFYQAGVSLYPNPQETDVGFGLEIGYERSPARNFVTFGSVKAEYRTQSEELHYMPTLGLLIAF